MPIIISLGWNCILKNELRKMEKKNKVKEEWNKSLISLPFDFVQTHDINKVLLAMENKFVGIMEKENIYLKNSHTIPRTNPNSKYMQHVFIQRKYGMKLMHRFQSLNTDEDRNNIYKNYDNVKKTFDRQSERFLEFVSGDEKIYFCRYLGALQSNKQLTKLAYKQEHEILSKKLKQLYPNLNYELVIFRDTSSLKKFISQAFV